MVEVSGPFQAVVSFPIHLLAAHSIAVDVEKVGVVQGDGMSLGEADLADQDKVQTAVVEVVVHTVGAVEGESLVLPEGEEDEGVAAGEESHPGQTGLEVGH